jgi:hypothetical protein
VAAVSKLQAVFDWLAERSGAVFGRLFSAHVEVRYAEQVAGLLSRLEDQARQYEADGQPEVAATLRQRARALAGDNPLALGATLLDQIGTGPAPALPPAAQQPPALPEAPTATPPAQKTGRRKLTLPPAPPATEEGQS